jgi:hypothetical protein
MTPKGNLYSVRHRNVLRLTPVLLNEDKLEQAAQPYTFTWDELEEWQRDNEYILSGYRRYVSSSAGRNRSESRSLAQPRPQHHWKGCIESVYTCKTLSFSFDRTSVIQFVRSPRQICIMRQVPGFIYDFTLTHSIPFSTTQSISTRTCGAQSFSRTSAPHFTALTSRPSLRLLPGTTPLSSSFSCCLRLRVFLRVHYTIHRDAIHRRSGHFHVAALSDLSMLIKVASRCHAYDYSGIIILTVGSFYPALYYGFFCHLYFKVFYLTGTTLAGIGESKF